MKEQKRVPKLRFVEFVNNEIPKRSFNELFIFSTGKNIKHKEASPEFEIPCVRYGELYHLYNEVIEEIINRTNIDKSELHFSEGNEVLLPSAGEDPLDIGSASALMVKDVAIGRTINVLRPKTDNIYSQKYIAYYINQKLKRKISTLAKGSSISNVYNSDLKKLHTFLPSLKEQQKIATFLSTIDKKITQLQQKKDLLEDYKKGVMQQIFSQELKFTREDGSAYPDWEEKRLGEIGKTINGLTGKTKENFGTGKPYIQYKQIFDGSKINIEDCGLVDIKENERQTKLRFGDVFFTTSSETANEIGTASVLLNHVEEMYLNSFCFGLRIKQNILKPSFAQFLFRSSEFRRKMIPLAQGSTRYNISKSSFLKLNVELPCIEEQTQIAEFLSAIDTKIAVVQTQIAQTQRFKKGLLQQMFV